MKSGILGIEKELAKEYLPRNISVLNSVGEAALHRWELLALGDMGCELLKNSNIQCRILLLPGRCSMPAIQADTIVSYGLSAKDSLTLSSIQSPVLCVQRILPCLDGGIIEPQEYPMPAANVSAETLLLLFGTRLLLTGRPV